MSYNSPEVVILSIEHPQLHDKALKWAEGCDNVTEGVKVKVEQCDYNEAPQKLDTGVSKLICTVSDHREEVWLILNEDNPDQTTEEGRKPASLPQSATATYKTIGGQPGNGDLILDRSTVPIAKKTYNDEIANEAGIARIFEAAKSSNSVIVHAPLHLMRLAFGLVKKLAEGMSPDLVLKPEAWGLVDEPLSHIHDRIYVEKQYTMKVSEVVKCACAGGRRACGIPTENDSKAKIIEDVVKGKQIEAEFSRFKTPETFGAQPYQMHGLTAGFFRAHDALAKVCPAQAYGCAPRCKSMSVGIENFIWDEKKKTPIDLAIVVVRSGPVEVFKLTKGVTLQEAYVRRAQSFGELDEWGNRSRVTVGAVIAAHTGYSAANWHMDIAKVNRYQLHRETLAEALNEFKRQEALLKRDEDAHKVTFHARVILELGNADGGNPEKTMLKGDLRVGVLEKF